MTEVILQAPVGDHELDQNSPTYVWGGATAILYLRDQTSKALRIVMKFTNTIPSGNTVSSAVLALYYYGNDPSGADPVNRVVDVYKMTQPDWVELQATWNNYKAGSAWTTPGGDYVTSNPAGGNFTFPAATGAWVEASVVAITQNAIDGSSDIYFLLKFNDETKSSTEDAVPLCHSGNYSDDLTLRPKLTVNYAATAFIPKIFYF